MRGSALAFVFIAASAACSLDGLTSGGAGGSGGTGPGTGGTTSVGGSPNAGGSGGEAPETPFSWLVDMGNELVQGTSPYTGTDAEATSTLRLSNVGPSGDVWVAMATRRSIDPDGAGGFPAEGKDQDETTRIAYVNLFVGHLDAKGKLLWFDAWPLEPATTGAFIDLGAIVSVDDGNQAVLVGSFARGTLDFGDAGLIEGQGTSTDAFVIRVADGHGATHARHLSGTSTQNARALAVGSAGRLYVGGNFRSALQVKTGGPNELPDDPCTYNVTEIFDRSFVLEMDADDLDCGAMFKTGATTMSAAQRVLGLAADADSVVAVGEFSQQIIIDTPPFNAKTIPAAGGLDGYVLSLSPDLESWSFGVHMTTNLASGSEGIRTVTFADGEIWVGGYHETGGAANGTPIMRTFPDETESCGFETVPSGGLRDIIVARLDMASGVCSAVRTLGGPGRDEVRAMVEYDAGRVVFGGFYSSSLPPIDERGVTARNAFLGVMRTDAQGEIVVDESLAFGGTSWDYLDGLSWGPDGIVAAGSFDQAFDQRLSGNANFYVGLLPDRR